jgi:hypothetical protein
MKRHPKKKWWMVTDTGIESGPFNNAREANACLTTLVKGWGQTAGGSTRRRFLTRQVDFYKNGVCIMRASVVRR